MKTIYLEIDGVKGSEKHGNLTNQIPIQNFSFGVERFVRSVPGSTKNREHSVPHVTKINLVKGSCVATPGLHSKSMFGKGVQMKIRVIENAGEANSHVSSLITLKNATITSHQIMCNENTGMQEHMQISFTNYTMECTPVDSFGKKGTTAVVGYDIEKVKKI